jgi:hypothetical protein
MDELAVRPTILGENASSTNPTDGSEEEVSEQESFQ